MIHIPNIDIRKLYRWAGERGLFKNHRGDIDDGLLLHTLIAKVFRAGDIRPFRFFLPRHARLGTLYAYSSHEAKHLLSSAQEVAPPDCLTVLNLDKIQSKLMPATFSTGKRLGFDLRVKPVRRLSKELADPQSGSGKLIAAGSEVDAFRLELLKNFPGGWKDESMAAANSGVSRESVYTKWLEEKFADAAELSSCQLAHFRRVKSFRGDKHDFEGPDAILHGDIVVKDPTRFSDLLRKGVGRHKSYGYGMLLLRPSKSE
ncbi:MAG: type I-E CRISPR-associated protein Cas6/Cse3/CasE [Proteobacteria bacterium]|nr:type I-E CRISPR-associated protein Cas6/Cse3/CasE [Pseudomonadota bacterium]